MATYGNMVQQIVIFAPELSNLKVQARIMLSMVMAVLL